MEYDGQHEEAKQEMLVTTKGRYALRMMLNIAGYGTDRKIALRQVAEEEKISLKYLEQLAHSMVEAGLLTSARGHGGGYALARPASEIRIGDVLRTAEDGIVPVACTGLDNECADEDTCPILEFWAGLNKVIEDYIDKPTLADLAAQRTCSA